MRVVVCKNCGANFQIDDDEDINTYECSICTGELKYDENYGPVPAIGNIRKFDTSEFDNDYEIAQCTNCGLKFKLNINENINEYECSSCGGSLKYLNNESEYNPEFEEPYTGYDDYEYEYENSDDDGYIYVDHSHDNEDYTRYNDNDNYNDYYSLNSNEEIYNKNYLKEDNENNGYQSENENIYSAEYNNPMENTSNAVNDNLKDNLKEYKISTLDSYYNEKHENYKDNVENLLKDGKELKVPSSLDYNDLKEYLVKSFKIKMINRYKLQDLILEKKT